MTQTFSVKSGSSVLTESATLTVPTEAALLKLTRSEHQYLTQSESETSEEDETISMEGNLIRSSNLVLGCS